jgi:poly-gamma-glutamate synthesis protein (capsule biosynthesis protein)
MKWKIAVFSGFLGAFAAFVTTVPPVRVAITNVWEQPPVVREESTAHVLFVGDIMLSRSVGDEMAARNDWSWPFAVVASETAGADLTFGNLESVISDRGIVEGCRYCFRADPRAMQGLLTAGFDVVSVANNHVLDYGQAAFDDSLRRLRESGITPVGDAGPIFKEVQGMRVAFLAYSYPLRQDKIVSDIAAARPLADVMVVSFHDGTEYETVHNAEQERIFRGAIDAGADLVIGHHPHVVQDTEKYGRGWIFYSLGNFIFDQLWSPETMRGLGVDVAIRAGRITDIATRSVDISRQYQASVAPTGN